jgi:Icc-related predicted phosphoesterase
MKIATISDTHNQHILYSTTFLKEENVDMLICAGDASNTKSPYINENELRNFLEWMSSLRHIKYKIFVPGNHDTSFEKGLIKRFQYPNIIFLVDETITIKEKLLFGLKSRNIKIHGSPFTPTFGTGWAYNCKRSKIYKHWEMIPDDTDILITHGPPKYISDYTVDFDRNIINVGDKSLLNKVLEIQPKFHIFGHVHDEKGHYNNGVKTLGNKCKTTFINASIVDLKHNPVNTPIIFKI